MTAMTAMTALGAVALALAAGCHGGDRAESRAAAAAAGTERGACRPGGGCDRGLVCLSDLCVRPPSADCAKIGEALSYLLLDDYAAADERARVREDVARQCAEQAVSPDEGACLLRAQSRAELRACPKVVGLGDCARIGKHLDGIRGASGVDAYLVTSADRIIARCRSEAPTIAFERCVLAARTLDDVDRCAW